MVILENIDIDIDIDKEILKISIFKEDLNNTYFYIYGYCSELYRMAFNEIYPKSDKNIFDLVNDAFPKTLSKFNNHFMGTTASHFYGIHCLHTQDGRILGKLFVLDVYCQQLGDIVICLMKYVCVVQYDFY